MARNSDDLLRWGDIEKAIFDHHAAQKNSVYGRFSADAVEGTLYVLEDVPAVEAKPVKHGRWIEKRETIHWVYEDTAECSVCCEEFILDEYDIADIRMLFKYCPNCGAKMDE